MSTTGKTISELSEEKTLSPGDMLVAATTDGRDKKITTQGLFRSMHQPKTIAEGKAGDYVQGEIMTMIDYTDPAGLAQGQFMAFVYTHRPDWFNGDVPNALYEVAGSQGKVLLLNLALTTSTGLVLTLAQANQLKHLLNNTGKLFYEPMKKTLCVMMDNVVHTIPLQPLPTTENTP